MGTLRLILALAVVINHGLYGDPWLYRYFPFELALFLGGALAYRLYAHRNTHHFLNAVSALIYVETPLDKLRNQRIRKSLEDGRVA